MMPFSLIIGCICVCTSVCVCVFLNIQIQSTASALHYLCVFRTDHLVLDSQLGCSYLGRLSPTLNIPLLPRVFCVGMGLCGHVIPYNPF